MHAPTQEHFHEDTLHEFNEHFNEDTLHFNEQFLNSKFPMMFRLTIVNFTSFIASVGE